MTAVFRKFLNRGLKRVINCVMEETETLIAELFREDCVCFCPSCRAECVIFDTYCHECGEYLR